MIPREQILKGGLTTPANSRRRSTFQALKTVSESGRLTPHRWLITSDEPPYFIPGLGSTQSIDAESTQRRHPPYALFQERAIRAATVNSSADDYRSVIDDLTIENKKLREKLRKYEKMNSTHLEKDKLFEVKIYALPSAKRRELEDTLRDFASKIDGSTDDVTKHTANSKIGAYPPHIPTSGSDPKNHSSSCTSNSRPVDSAYASMSLSGPTSTSTHNTGGLKKSKPHSQSSKDQKIHTFLLDIPEGLLPKHSNVMTERQKKKLVVKRLEQLFTGKVKGIIANHNQTLQQQEVSTSAARADQASNNQSAGEGVREANMLPQEMEVDQPGPPGLSLQPSRDEISPVLSVSDTSGTTNTPSSDQRPTRPLDLDPDREQIPTENVEYIRHLGLSTPQLITEDSSDAEQDADGWIYLNLLINMAQLHIMNVTPDFVRSAVSEVSAKFQLSKDGKKIRWRGGNRGTRLSSDSDNSSPSSKRRQESDCGSEDNQKRRRLEGLAKRTGQFSSVPLRAKDTLVSAPTVDKPFHYKPLFHPTSSPSEPMPLEDATSILESSPADVSGITGSSRGQSSRSTSKRRTDDGPIVFYGGAKFCTDLSSDCANIPTPLHVTDVAKDGYSNHTDDALGAPTRPISTFLRTPSGSSIQTRPFRNSSLSDLIRFSSPDPLTSGESADDDLDMNLEWSSRSSPHLALLDLSASGLGGTQPADHFALSVRTRRTKLGIASQGKPTRFSWKHSISRSSLDVFRDAKTTDEITERLASMGTFSVPQQSNKMPRELPVRSEIIETKMVRLQPSALPEPSAYYEAMSTSDGEADSDSGESELSGISKYRRPESFYYRPMTLISQPDIQSPLTNDFAEESEDDESDDSIDMLAHLRAVDPATVAAQEQEFQIGIENPTQSSAMTVDGKSETSSSVEEEADSDDDGE